MTLAEWTGLEPATSGVTGQHSNRLNYHSAEPGMIQSGFECCNRRLRASRCDSDAVAGVGPMGGHGRLRCAREKMVGAEGFEPPTLSV